MSKSFAALAIALGVAACAEFPQIEPLPVSMARQTPQLVPIDTLLAQAASQQADRTAPLLARAARLRARAGLMRGPMLDPATRERLRSAIATD